MKKKSLHTIRPILHVNNGVAISRLGSYSMVYQLKMKPVFSMTELDYERCAEAFSRILNIIPDNSIVQKMDVYYTKTSKLPYGDSDTGVQILKDAYNRKFYERNYVNHESYLVFSKTCDQYLNKISLNSLIFKTDFIAKEFIDDTVKDEFFKGIAQAESIFKESPYFTINKLDTEAILKLCNAYENLSFGKDIKFSSDIFQDKTDLRIGKNHLSCVALNSLNGFPLEYEDIYIDPSYASNKSALKFSMFHPIGLGFHADHIVNQVFIKEPEHLVKKNLDKSEKDNLMFSFANSGNSVNYKDIQGFKGDLNKGFNPIKYHANVLLWDTDRLKLDDRENQIIAAFNKIRLTPNVTYGDTLPLYWSCYPGNIADIGAMDQSFYLLDRQATALNIYETNTTSTVGDFGVMFSERLSGAPIYVDISDEPLKRGLTNNRNKIVIGPSGSGKSFTTNVMLNSYLMTGAHVVAVDVGDSYERLCKLYNGKYFRYNPENPLAFNPLNVTKRYRTIEKKESLITLFFTLWKKNPDDYNKDEYTILSDSISKYYQHEDHLNTTHLSFNRYYEFMQEVFVPELKEKKIDGLFDASSFF